MRYGTEAFALGGLTETLTTGSASQDLCGKRCRSCLQVRCTASLIGRRLFYQRQTCLPFTSARKQVAARQS